MSVQMNRDALIDFYDTVSEWLRRWTRNPLGSARRGSNPLGVDVAAPVPQHVGVISNEHSIRLLRRCGPLLKQSARAADIHIQSRET